MKFTVKLADKIIELNSIYPGLQRYCKDYIVEDLTPDFSVSWTNDEVLAEENSSDTKGFSAAYLETLTALRKICEIFPSYQRFLMHGASISYDGKAYLFTAPSGTGKSTHIRLWHEYLGEGVQIVNGDKPFISIENEEVRIYGTPWAGKENWQRNCSAPLAGICFLKRGTENKIYAVTPQGGIAALRRQLYTPTDEALVKKGLALVDRLAQLVPLWQLRCNMQPEAAEVSYRAMRP